MKLSIKTMVCLSVFALCCVFAALPGYASGGAFSDVGEGDWHYPYIMELADRGLTRGNDDGTYAPDCEVRVDEFLAFTLRALGHEFRSGGDNWAEPYIEEALGLGLIRRGEYEDYGVPITREKIAEIAVRASDTEATGYDRHDGIFSDIAGSIKKNYILMAVELGVIAGYEDGTFRPQNTATRAEAATIVLRMADDGYRVEQFGNILLDMGADVNENGVLIKEKASAFIMEAINSLHIGVSENNKAVISGHIPIIPEGQIFLCDIMFCDANGKILSFRSTATLFKEQQIPLAGAFEIETIADADKIMTIMIDMCVSKGEPPLNFKKPSIAYSIYKEYRESDSHITQAYLARVDGIPEAIIYDFSLTEGIWGW